MRRTAVVVGVALVPAYVIAGLFAPVSEAARVAGPIILVGSGLLIARWWAGLPAVLTFAALAVAEQANYMGVGPGSRVGTVIELHTGPFSPSFTALVLGVALALPTLGAVIRHLVARLARGSGA